MPVACSPVDLLQLLQPAVYPESDAATVAAQARRASPLSSLVARIGAAMLRRESWGQISVARRMTLLALVLLAAVALLKLSRGSVLRAVGLLFRYSRR